MAKTATGLKVSLEDAVKVLTALKFHNAAKWDSEKVQTKLNLIHEVGDTKNLVKSVKDKKVAALIKKILSVLEDGGEVEVQAEKGKKGGKPEKDKKSGKKGGKKSAAKDDDEDEEEDEEEEDEEEDSDDDEDEEEDEDSDEEDEDEDEDEDDDDDDDDDDSDDDDDDDDDEDEPKTKKGKKMKKDKKGKKSKKEKTSKEPVERDWAGNRFGTRAHRLNMAITDKPRTVAQIKEKAEYDKPIHGHLKWMLDRKLIIKTENKKGKVAYIRNPKKAKKK